MPSSPLSTYSFLVSNSPTRSTAIPNDIGKLTSYFKALHIAPTHRVESLAHLLADTYCYNPSYFTIAPTAIIPSVLQEQYSFVDPAAEHLQWTINRSLMEQWQANHCEGVAQNTDKVIPLEYTLPLSQSVNPRCPPEGCSVCNESFLRELELGIASPRDICGMWYTIQEGGILPPGNCALVHQRHRSFCRAGNEGVQMQTTTTRFRERQRKEKGKEGEPRARTNRLHRQKICPMSRNYCKRNTKKKINQMSKEEGGDSECGLMRR
jgi:hypothetical protein